MSTENTDQCSEPRFNPHFLVCVNARAADNPKGDCSRCQGQEIRLRFVQLIQERGLKGRARATKTHCLDACEWGAVVVAYPADRWYVQVELSDVEAIFAAELKQEAYLPRLATPETWLKLKEKRRWERY